MAITLTSRFNPFTFEEMVKPLILYKGAYDKVDNDLTNLSMQSEYWKNIASRENNPESYRLYTEFEDTLNSAVDNFSQGLRRGNTVSRQLLDAKRKYSSNILPIQEAYKAREVDRKLQAEIMAKDPSVMFNNYASQSNLDSYLNGQKPEYISVSGTDLYNRALKGATGISARRFQEREGRAFAGDYFKLTKEYGYSPAEAAQILADPRRYPEFNQLIGSIINGTGVETLSPQDKTKALNRIMEGINAGMVYRQDSSLQDNWRAKINAQKSYSTSNINRGIVNFAKGTTEINNMLGEDGKIKETTEWMTGRGPATSMYENARGIRSQGPLRRQSVNTFNSDGSLNPNSPYAMEIKKVLLNAGVPMDFINSMTKSDMENTLTAIKEEGSRDVIPTNMYRFPFNEAATEGILALVNTRGDKFTEVKGYDEKGNLKTGERKKLEYEDGKVGEGYFDSSTGNWYFLMDGNYYLLPKNTLSSSTYSTVSEYARSFENLRDIINVLDSKLERGEPLSYREKQIYNEAMNNIGIIDEYFGTVGNQLADAVGPRNINK